MARNHLNKMRPLRPIEEIVNETVEHSVEKIRLDELVDDMTFQYRREVNVDLLAEDIRRQGQLIPILVRLQRGKYQLIGGFRRVQALRLLGETHVLARIFRDISDEMAFEMCVSENLQRADLTPLELAKIIQQYRQQGLSLRQIEERIELSKSSAKNYLDILDYPAIIQEGLHLRKWTLSHALELGKCSPDSLPVFVQLLEKEELSVRELKRRIEAFRQKKSKMRTPTYHSIVRRCLWFRPYEDGFDLKLSWRQEQSEKLPQVVAFLEEKLMELKAKLPPSAKG